MAVPSPRNNDTLFCQSQECTMCLQLPTVYQRNLCFRHWLRTIVQNDVLQYIPATCAAIQLQTRKVVFDFLTAIGSCTEFQRVWFISIQQQQQ